MHLYTPSEGANGDSDFPNFDLIKNPNWTNIKLLSWISVKPAVRQIHSPHLHADAPGNFSDLLKSVQMLNRERERERGEERRGVRKATGSYRIYSILGKTAVLVPKFAVEDLPLAELQPRFIMGGSLVTKWRACEVGEAKEGLENELWRRWNNGRIGEWAVT